MDIDRLKFKSLLVIALDEHNIGLIKPNLEMHFKEVIFEENPEKAYTDFFGEQKNSTEIDLVLYNLNGSNHTVLEKIRQTNRRIPIFSTCEDFLKIPSNFVLRQRIFTSYEQPIDIQLLLKESMYALKDVAKRKFAVYSHKVATVVRTNLKGEIIYVNNLFCKASSLEKEEILGKAFNTFKHDTMSEAIFEALWEDINNNKVWHGILKLQDKNKEAFYINSTIFPILDSNDNLREYLNIGFVVTKEEENISKLKHYIVSQKTAQIQNNKSINEQIQQNVEQAIKNEKNKIEALKKVIYELEDDLNKTKNSKRQQSKQINMLEDALKKIQQREENEGKVLKERLREVLKENLEFTKNNEKLIKRNEALNEKNEKAQESIKVFQGYIDEYRKKIEDLQDVIAANEKEIKDLKK